MTSSAPIPVNPQRNNTDTSASASSPTPHQFAFSSPPPRQMPPGPSDSRFSTSTTFSSSPENTLSQSFQGTAGSLPGSFSPGSLSDQLSRSVSVGNNSFSRHRRRSTLGDLFGISGNNSAVQNNTTTATTNSNNTSSASAASPSFPGLPLNGALSTSPASSDFSADGPVTPPTQHSLPQTTSLPPLKTDYSIFNGPPGGYPDSAAKPYDLQQQHPPQRRYSWAAAPSSPIFSGTGLLSWLSSSPVKANETAATVTATTTISGELDAKRRASDQTSPSLLGRLKQQEPPSPQQAQQDTRGRDARRRPSNIRRLSPMAERMIRGHYGDH